MDVSSNSDYRTLLGPAASRFRDAVASDGAQRSLGGEALILRPYLQAWRCCLGCGRPSPVVQSTTGAASYQVSLRPGHFRVGRLTEHHSGNLEQCVDFGAAKAPMRQIREEGQ